MKKKNIGIAFLVIGIILLVLVPIVFLIHNNETGNSNETGNNENKTIKVDTTKIKGDEIANSNYEVYTYEKEFISEYVKSHNINTKNKISFPIFSDMTAYDIDFTEFSKGFVINDINISATIIETDKSLEEYINEIVSGYSTDGGQLNYSSSSVIEINNTKIVYAKLECLFVDEETNQKYYNEYFYILVSSAEDEMAVIKYDIIDKRFSDEFLTKIINQIKVEKSSAKYLISSNTDNKLIGTLTQSKLDGTMTEYKVTYNISSEKYKEVENGKNTINYTTFTSTENKNLDITLELRTSAEEDIKEMMETYINENYKITDYKVSDIVFKNEDYTRISFSYTLENEKRYKQLYINQIDDNAAFIITIDSNDNIDLIADFVNYSIEK